MELGNFNIVQTSTTIRSTKMNFMVIPESVELIKFDYFMRFEDAVLSEPLLAKYRANVYQYFSLEHTDSLTIVGNNNIDLIIKEINQCKKDYSVCCVTCMYFPKDEHEANSIGFKLYENYIEALPVISNIKLDVILEKGLLL